MLDLTGGSYENIELQGYGLPFDQLSEADYLASVFEQLQRRLGRSFNDFHFIVYSGLGVTEVDLSHADPARTVVLHISDETASVPYELSREVLAVFKNYLPGENLAPNLYSLPLGYAASVPDYFPVPVNERGQSVFFSGVLNRHRVSMFKALALRRASFIPLPSRAFSRAFRRLSPSITSHGGVPGSYIRFTTSYRSGLSGDQYAKHLVNSKIVLCPRGWVSSETFRHFEAMRAGAIVISEELPPLRLYEGSPLVRVKSWDGVRGLLEDLLASPDQLAELQAQTLAWWADVCSESATADAIAGAIS